MALLEMGGRKFTIPAGEVALGSAADCAIQLTGPGITPKTAILKGLPDGQVSIRKMDPQGVIAINGVNLGAEPTPLLHGDKIQTGGNELTFVDERRSGSTQYVAAMDVAKAAAAAKASAGAGKPTSNTGGRIVSLTDGREYAVTGASLVFGREAGCDVVVTGKDVSRRHAEIVTTPKGYMVVDSSTNGTFVNDEKIEGQRLLMRADVIKIGDEQFRFYADAAAAAAPPSPPAGPAASPPQAATPTTPPPSGAGHRLNNTSFGMAAAPRPSATAPSTPAAPAAPAAMGNFLFRTGPLKGQRYQIKTPVLNIGRADYNDLVLADASVSTSHAKLQRREGVWMLVDLDSTNGTFVDGEKISGESPLAPGTMVRFGDVQAVFEPTDDAMGTAKGGGTKVIEAFKPGAAPAPAPKAAAPAPPPPPKAPAPAPAAPPPVKRQPVPPPVPAKKKGCGASAAMFILGGVSVLYWILR
ncbi:MAG TPA: FHA domain-containing protein [Gemmatimonadales bacterium]|nr:FHA domain-containing protein [Gemmatimonadales bacterium]